MKSFIIALCILALFVGVMFFASNLLTDFEEEMQTMLHSVKDCIENENWDKAENDARFMQKEWEKKTKWLSCFIEHDEIDDIMTTIASITEFTKYKEEPELMSEIAKLERLIEHIPRKERPIPENLF